MTLRDRFLRLLGAGEPDEVDPEAVVEAGVVPFAMTAIVMSELDAAGIPAHSTDERFPAGEGGVTQSRVMCRAADVAAARQVIDDVTTTG